MAGETITYPSDIPTNIQAALRGILNDVYGSQVRQDIVTALSWGIEPLISEVSFINGLGLTVEDGKLCYTTKDVIVADGVTSDIRGLLQKILADVNGLELRKDIVDALRWASVYSGKSERYIDDIGLVVQDGKLCVIYYGGEDG